MDIAKPTDYIDNWNRYASEILGVNLDEDQQMILDSIMKSRRVTVRSGHARGKDFLAAVASLCFLNLNIPSKVISTAPSGRQVVSIMMSEISKIHANSRVPLGGTVLESKVKMLTPDWFLEGFKAGDKDTESWHGYHSPNLMVVITEASGIADESFNAMEGILTGNSKLLLVGNPIRPQGEFAKSFKSPLYTKHILNCLNAPNVLQKRTVIPGQVDWEWVDDHVQKWCVEINKDQSNKAFFDFEWEGKAYRPNNLFISKVIGEFPLEGEDQLIPLSWIEQANDRWRELQADPERKNKAMKLGVDIAGLGRDNTVFCSRYDNYVDKFEKFIHQDHMVTAGRIKNALIKSGDKPYIDTIGEGAGVGSRLGEMNIPFVSAKFSEGTKLQDMTGEHDFVNTRAYSYWAIRDNLDPRLNGKLALPPSDELAQDLTEPRVIVKSNGKYAIEEKEKIKERLGRSPDWGDALALTYFPTSGGWANTWQTVDREE